ncbi:hypothetical protein [Aeromicrobium fastidiosum]|uniref:Uncharacterized protein n=1 Tax=Aeromicrobium fastidiosum TaxID=52699 RepID=A0A641ALI4_9ACTN|nr:hypothetical protein [Aeromicrobium fastidiosum]KAA1376118.1 hypothetical protein ESP62_011780 [Aeromicrobium fastidiosum]MBP2392002.1 hypothetical protein [Aeromicrobium fastidiosum]
MTGIRVRSTWNLQPLLDELDRFADLPTERAIAELDSVLGGSFAVTQAFVHVKTGRLKASGRVRSFEHERTWTGHIQYGGAEAYWSQWEFSREGHHPFDDDPAFHAQEGRYADAIDQIIRHG